MEKYNLEYWIGKKKVETILTNQNNGLCIWKKRNLEKQQNYKLGELKIVPVVK